MLRSARSLFALAGGAALSVPLFAACADAKPAAASAPPADMRDRMTALVKKAQRDLVAGLEGVDGGKFLWDEWTREGGGGGGCSCVMQDSTVFEKAGVNVSVVHGVLPAAAVRQMSARGKDLGGSENPPYFACGVSIVIHPRNPMAPTMHANYRYFEVQRADGTKLGWFGGGSDLTPSYLNEDDARYFHNTLKAACDRHPEVADYAALKQWCDDYFYIPFRKEHRGVGGIFFDDLEEDHEAAFEFVRDAAAQLVPSYVPIVARRKDEPFTQQQKDWQQLRRGRYVEFNVAIDRGTKFGLAMPNARTESILMSLPLTARWEYRHEPAPGSPEAATMAVLQQPAEWAQPCPDLSGVSLEELTGELLRREC